MTALPNQRRLALAAFAGALLATAGLRAEMFFDLGLGASFIQGTDVKVKDETTFPESSARESVSFDPSITAGMRFGGWIDSVPFLGFACDFSFFQADGGPIERNNIFPLSFLVLFRGSLLQSRTHPYGRLQPYAAIGPSTVFSDTVIDLRPAVSQRVSTSAADIGLDVRAGLAFEVVPHIALFAEYRFLYFEQHLDETTDFGSFATLDASARMTCLTHHVMLGVSFRF